MDIPLLDGSIEEENEKASCKCINNMQNLDILEAFDDDGHHHHYRNIAGLQSNFQTIVNTVNLYVGVGLLSLGYAFRLGGWVSLAVLGAFSLTFCHSAKMLSWSFDRMPLHVTPSYPNLGAEACGAPGKWMVMLMGVAEFFGACCLKLIVFWQSIEMLLPTYGLCLSSYCLSKRMVAMIGSMLLTVPSIWIRTFSRLSSISVSGIISSLLLTSVVVAAYILDPESESVNDATSHEIVDWPNMPIAMGIFVISLSGHTGLPSLRRSMVNPDHFGYCLNMAFLIMTILYATMAGLTYMYFGKATKVLVTSNLNESSSVKGITLLHFGDFSLSINQAVTALVALNAYSSLPALVYVIAELILDMAQRNLSSAVPGFLEFITRTLVLGLAYLTAIVAYDVLDSVESIIGGACSVSVSLLIPSIFYYQVYKGYIGLYHKILVLALGTFGVICVIGIASINILKLCNILMI